MLPFSVMDPDGDAVTVTASQHRGPACAVEVSPRELVVTIPDDAPRAQKIHIIVQAVDNGSPALTGYARFVLTLRRRLLSSAARVASVTAEHRSDSPFVATDRPRVSWIVDDAPVGWTQSAAQVRLDGANVVQLEGDENVLRPWPFAPLADDRPHMIEVRVADALGSFSGWSSPREVRLATVAEWSAPFIGLADPTRPAQPALLSHTFSVGDGVVGALVHVSAFGIAEVSIDGTVIDDTVLGPGWTSYDSRVLHDTVDVLPLLAGGRSHRIQIRLTGGWFTEEYGFGPQGTRVYGDQPSAALELHLVYADGHREVIRTTTRGPPPATGRSSPPASTPERRSTSDATPRLALRQPSLETDVIPEARYPGAGAQDRRGRPSPHRPDADGRAPDRLRTEPRRAAPPCGGRACGHRDRRSSR